MNDYALIAEPDEARASVYAAIAAELGLLPIIIGDGARAAEMVSRRGAPRLAFVELALPCLNGFQLIERLRAAGSASDTRIIASSPFRELREAAREMRGALEIGAVLAKAATNDSVRRVAQQLCGEARCVLYPDPPTPPEAAAAREAQRIGSLRASGLVNGAPDKAPEPYFQDYIADVARELDVSVALITLALEDKFWYFARYGITDNQIERADKLCDRVIETGEMLVVPDAQSHPVFASNAIVRLGFIRGYASTPLITSTGDVWGTLCVLESHRPLLLPPEKLSRLRARAREVIATLERRQQRSSVALA